MNSVANIFPNLARLDDKNKKLKKYLAMFFPCGILQILEIQVRNTWNNL